MKMPISRKQLPQINWTKITIHTLSILLLITAIVNLYLLLFPAQTQLTKLRNDILKYPFSPKVHINLAKYYFQTGNSRQAKREIELAYSLGSQEAPLLYKQIATSKSNLDLEVKYWKSVTEKYPNYRDAYIKLAALNYQLSNSSAAAIYLEKARRIDPNYPEAVELDEAF
jgi:tetratricopeptide (TPR) repeat protein